MIRVDHKQNLFKAKLVYVASFCHRPHVHRPLDSTEVWISIFLENVKTYLCTNLITFNLELHMSKLEKTVAAHFS